MVYFSGNCACLCVRDAGIMGTSLETLFQRVFANPENYMKTKFDEKGQPIPVMEPFKPIVLPNFQITRDVLIPLDLRIKIPVLPESFHKTNNFAISN